MQARRDRLARALRQQDDAVGERAHRVVSLTRTDGEGRLDPPSGRDEQGLMLGRLACADEITESVEPEAALERAPRGERAVDTVGEGVRTCEDSVADSDE